MTLLVYAQAAFAPLNLSRHMDPTLRLAGGYAALARDVQAIARQRGATFVAVDDYGPAALLAALGPACIKLVAIEPRWSLFALPSGAAAMDGATGLLLRSQRRHDAPDPADWAHLAPVATLTRARNGRAAEDYTLYEGVGRPGTEPSALLPCPHRAPT